jgi:hypothetical protein
VLGGGCFESKEHLRVSGEEERTLLIYLISYMHLYTCRAVCTDNVWSCLATTCPRASHDVISHGAHDPGHLRCYPATGACLHFGTWGHITRACTAGPLGT